MAFKITDFKKTTRAAGGERALYPYQIRDDRYTAAIGYAIAYYERMVGRRRAEFEAEALLEFFGDPRLARGLVACLAQTYAWRAQSFAEALGDDAAQVLARNGISTPADLRRRLYGLANGRYGGVILPHERGEALAFLCERLTEDEEPPAEESELSSAVNVKPWAVESNAAARRSPAVARQDRLTPAQIERGLTLDSEDQHVLVKLGATPTPESIVARYNYHSLETALCQSEQLTLRMRGPVWGMIRSAHGLARRYRLRYTVAPPRTLFDEEVELTIHGQRDVFGSWGRAGRRLVRLLLRLLAAHPGCLRSGEARVHLGSQAAVLRLDDRALDVLGAAARAAAPEPGHWDEDLAEGFRRAWARAFVGGRAGGWRLRRDPEPLIGRGALVVPDFLLQRGGERVAVCIAPGRATAVAVLKDLARLGAGVSAVVITPAQVAETLASCPAPIVTYEAQPAEAAPALATLLERRFPRGRAVALTPWQQLERMVADEGFVGVETAAALLGCPPDEAERALQQWGGPALHLLPGLGVCAPEALPDIRQMLEAGAA